MSEFRVKLICNSVGCVNDYDDFYYPVNGISVVHIVRDALHVYASSLGLRSKATIQFNHPSLGWVDLDTDDSDDDLDGEAYLAQSG